MNTIFEHHGADLETDVDDDEWRRIWLDEQWFVDVNYNPKVALNLERTQGQIL